MLPCVFFSRAHRSRCSTLPTLILTLQTRKPKIRSWRTRTCQRRSKTNSRVLRTTQPTNTSARVSTMVTSWGDFIMVWTRAGRGCRWIYISPSRSWSLFCLVRMSCFSSERCLVIMPCNDVDSYLFSSFFRQAHFPLVACSRTHVLIHVISAFFHVEHSKSGANAGHGLVVIVSCLLLSCCRI